MAILANFNHEGTGGSFGRMHLSGALAMMARQVPPFESKPRALGCAQGQLPAVHGHTTVTAPVTVTVGRTATFTFQGGPVGA